MLNFFKQLFQSKTPNAALTWQQAGHAPNNAFWIFALPVHLVLQRDTFSLAEPVPLTLDNSEIDALTNTLNSHFKPHGCEFFWHENQWLLSLTVDPHIQTSAPKLAINKDISAFLPTGIGAKKWASFINEVQMLLFEHPVNIAREGVHKPVINSLWCYGLSQLK